MPAPLHHRKRPFLRLGVEKARQRRVLGLPKDCDTLARLLDFTSDEFAIPPWYGPEYEAELAAKKAAGTPVHASEQPWGVWGPHIITHFLHETGEVRHALPRVALYPVPYKDRRLILRPGWDETEMVTAETFSIHFYGRRMRRRIVSHENGIPRPRSLFGRLLKKHGIDPTLAPIPLKPGDPALPRMTIRTIDLAGKRVRPTYGCQPYVCHTLPIRPLRPRMPAFGRASHYRTEWMNAPRLARPGSATPGPGQGQR